MLWHAKGHVCLQRCQEWVFSLQACKSLYLDWVLNEHDSLEVDLELTMNDGFDYSSVSLHLDVGLIYRGSDKLAFFYRSYLR